LGRCGGGRFSGSGGGNILELGLRGKIAIVTGASKGIGEAIAEEIDGGAIRCI